MNKDNKTFDGTFNLKLTNLIDDHGQSESDWQITLAPGESILKCLELIDPFEKVSVSFTSSYIVK